jgi:hypothetical protein
MQGKNSIDGTFPAKGIACMKRFARTSACTDLRVKLKARYQHLTDSDLVDIDHYDAAWLDRMQRRLGGSTFEIAHLVEEVTGSQKLWPNPLRLRTERLSFLLAERV